MSAITSGIDLVDIAKFKAIFQKHASLVDEVFTNQEKEYCLRRKDPWKHLAAGLAAKEASLKALAIGFLGVGIGHALREIEVIPDSCGTPRLLTHGWIARYATRRGIGRWAVSVSHSPHCAMAIVVAMRSSSGGKAKTPSANEKQGSS